MSEEEQAQEQTEQKENNQEVEQELSEVEQQAMERGWSPDGPSDPNKRAISAEEFLDRQKLYDDLKARGRENKTLKQEVDALKKSHQTIAQRTYERARQELQQEVARAHEEGDTQTAIQKTDEIAKLDREREQEEQQGSGNETAIQEAFEEWRQENPWYQNDSLLRYAADAIGNELMSKDPSLRDRPDELLKEVTKQVKEQAPEKFSKPKRPNAVEGEKSGSGGQKKKYSIKSLPEEDQKIAKRIIDMGSMDEETYMKQYLGEQ